jgi:hypothetical protein
MACWVWCHCLFPFHILAHLYTGFYTRKLSLWWQRQPLGLLWAPVVTVFKAGDSKEKKKRVVYQSSSSRSIDDMIDLAWVTCPFSEAIALSRRILLGPPLRRWPHWKSGTSFWPSRVLELLHGCCDRQNNVPPPHPKDVPILSSDLWLC